MKLHSMAAIAAALSLSAVSASATTIDFDDLAAGETVTNQYAGVVFSTIPGSSVVTTAQSLGTSLPNFICTSTGGINCALPLYLDFLSPVSGLSFYAVGDDATGKNGEVNIFSGATLLGTVDTFGDGNSSAPQFVDLGAFSGITRIEITNFDPAGLGYDDFTFTVGGAVPEPASWAMMIAGLALAGGAMRRRNAARLVFA